MDSINIEPPDYSQVDRVEDESDGNESDGIQEDCGSYVEDDVLEEDYVVADCVEINQCVGCTRQFFTKSFLGDDAAVLAPSSDEEPASPRHRAGVASMAWRTTR